MNTTSSTSEMTRKEQEILELCACWQGRTVDDHHQRPGWTTSRSRAPRPARRSSRRTSTTTQAPAIWRWITRKLMKVRLRRPHRTGEGVLSADSDKRDPEYADKRDYLSGDHHHAWKPRKNIWSATQSWREECAAAEGRPVPTRKKGAGSRSRKTAVRIAGGAPQTFWQAVQLFNIATTLIQVESNGHSISYGRMDQWLYPYLRGRTLKRWHPSRRNSPSSSSRWTTSR